MNCCIKYMLNVCVQRVIKPCKCYLLGQFWSRTDRGLGFPHTPDNNHREESGGTPPETKHQIPQLKQLACILLLDVLLCKQGNKKLSKLCLKPKKKTLFFFKSIIPSSTNILQSSQNKTFGVMFRA